jgi:hypothetical protein
LPGALAAFFLACSVGIPVRVPHFAWRLAGSAGRCLLHLVGIFLVFELDEVGYIQKRITLQAEVDKGRLHARQNARHTSVVNGSCEGVFVLAFVINLRELIIF